MATQLIIPRQLDANGDSASGAKAYVYESGTTNPITVYTDTGVSIPHSSPIVANSAGYFAQSFYGGSLALKVVVTDSADATLVTYDPVPAVGLSGAAASTITFSPTTAVPYTNVQSAIVGVQSEADGRLDPLANAAVVTTSGGSGGAYTLTGRNTVSAYANGLEFEFVANHTNVGSGTDTLNVDSLGGIVIKKYSSGLSKVDLTAGDIATGDAIRVKHDGTHFVLVAGPPRRLASQTEAETGTDNTVLMTPLRATQAADVVKLSQQTASSSATLDFTQFDSAGFSSYFFVIENLVPATDSVDLYLRFSNDGGSTYESGASYYNHQSVVPAGAADGGGASTSTATVRQIDGAIAFIPLTRGDGTNLVMGSAAGEDGWSGTVWVYGPHTTKKTLVRSSGLYYDFSGQIIMADTAAAVTTAEDNDAARFLFSSGDIESGTITLFGTR